MSSYSTRRNAVSRPRSPLRRPVEQKLSFAIVEFVCFGQGKPSTPRNLPPRACGHSDRRGCPVLSRRLVWPARRCPVCTRRCRLAPAAELPGRRGFSRRNALHAMVSSGSSPREAKQNQVSEASTHEIVPTEASRPLGRTRSETAGLPMANGSPARIVTFKVALQFRRRPSRSSVTSRHMASLLMATACFRLPGFTARRAWKPQSALFMASRPPET